MRSSARTRRWPARWRLSFRPAARSSGARSSRRRDDPVGTRCDHGVVRLTDEEFLAAWPPVVRALASWSGSLDDAEEYAAEAFARVADRDDVDDLAAWCVSVAKRAWIDDHRRREVFTRIAPDLVTGDAMPTDSSPDPP